MLGHGLTGVFYMFLDFVKSIESVVETLGKLAERCVCASVTATGVILYICILYFYFKFRNIERV